MEKYRELTSRKKPTCKQFASFLVKSELTSDIPKTGLSVGVDVSIKSFLTFSSGQQVLNPIFFVTTEKVLAKAQRKLVKAPKGMVIKAKALKIVKHIHEQIVNKCEDFVKKVSLNLVKVYDLITFEDLNLRGMINEPLSSNAYS